MTEKNPHDMTDAEVLEWALMAEGDLAEAANTQRDSEWHQACFTACWVLSQEMSKRGIRLRPLH
jgi:hypothetical protein